MTPLPLTNFEELMWWEDQTAYPCSAFVRARFAGQLDRAAVETALSQALFRHPLLSCKIECRRGRWHWIQAEPQPVMVWNIVPLVPSDDFPRATRIDLRNEIGLRVYVSAGSQTSDLILHFHHSCCDGAGIFSFLYDLLIIYARKRGETSTRLQLPDYDSRQIVDRGRYGLTWWKLLKMLPRQLIGLRGVKQFMERSPIPLTPHVARPNHDLPSINYPSAVRHLFTVDETIRVRQAAQLQHVTTNELLTRDLFLALFQWRREKGFANEHDWLRMMVPMDLRSFVGRELPAANVVSSVFLDRRGQDGADPDQLLASIHNEMQIIKRNQLGLTLLFSLRLFQWLPGGIRKSVRTDKCTVSCIFTNVGRVLVRTPFSERNGCLVVGDTVLESLQVLAPLRPYNCAAFCVHQYAGQLAMDMHYDSDVLSHDQASRILELFVQQTFGSSSNSIAESVR